MKPLRARVEDRIRETICRACIYEKSDGGCSLKDPNDCPIISRIDKIIDVVRTIRSDKIDPYVERLREVICSECRMQDENGQCTMRDHADCALDDYFVLIVDLVESELVAEARQSAAS
ncbi:MAG: hypothetical protein L6Q92_14640 [Phycisphaerae bacterium]|nr:hypothetical protein [Phycisphaerae bacterium]